MIFKRIDEKAQGNYILWFMRCLEIKEAKDIYQIGILRQAILGKDEYAQDVSHLDKMHGVVKNYLDTWCDISAFDEITNIEDAIAVIDNQLIANPSTNPTSVTTASADVLSDIDIPYQLISKSAFYSSSAILSDGLLVMEQLDLNLREDSISAQYPQVGSVLGTAFYIHEDMDEFEKLYAALNPIQKDRYGELISVGAVVCEALSLHNVIVVDRVTVDGKVFNKQFNIKCESAAVLELLDDLADDSQVDAARFYLNNVNQTVWWGRKTCVLPNETIAKPILVIAMEK